MAGKVTPKIQTEFIRFYWDFCRGILKFAQMNSNQEGMKNASMWDTCSVSTDGYRKTLGKNKPVRANTETCTQLDEISVEQKDKDRKNN